MQDLNRNWKPQFLYYKTALFNICIAYFFSSCSSPNIPPARSIALEMLSLQTQEISLNNRKDHVLMVDLKEYNVNVISNNLLLGKVKTDTVFFKDIVRISKPLVMYFSSKQYGLAAMPGTKESPTRVRVNKPNIFDQSTMESILNADLLFGVYDGMPSHEIKGIELRHANVLLHFKIIDQQPNAKVVVNDLTVDFSPYNASANEYLAVVTGQWVNTYEILTGNYLPLPKVKISIADGNELFKVDLPNNIYPLESGKKYEFDIKLNRETGDADIEELVKTNWDLDIF